MNKDIDRIILAEIFEAYLIKGHSHRQIQQQLLGLPAPPRGGGFKTMEILHTYDIHGSEKAIFKSGIVRGKVNTGVEDLLIEYIDAQKEAERYFDDWQSQNPINPQNKPTTRLSLIKTRVYQDKLRKLTLKNYNNECALCPIKQEELLVCSHIIPWGSNPEKRLELTNTINLCRLHDILFEKGYFGFDLDFKLVVNSKKCDDHLNAILKNSKFRTPLYIEPNKDYIKYHLREVCRIVE